jgi:hypothetical protein
LIGKSSGVFGDFVWVHPWTLLITKSALERLRKAGVRMPGAGSTRLEGPGKELLELQLEPRAEFLRPEPASPPCSSCGRTRPRRRTTDPTVVAPSIPDDVDLMRGRISTNTIVGTQRFVDGIAKLQLTGLALRELASVNATNDDAKAKRLPTGPSARGDG